MNGKKIAQPVKLNGDLFSPFFLSSILLSSLYWAWMFLLYWSSALNAPILDDEAVLLFARACTTLGAAIALLVMAALHRKRENIFPPLVSATVTALAMATPPLMTLAFVLGVSFTPTIICLCWFIAGVGSAYLLTQIGKMLSFYRTESATVLQFIALILAVALCLLTLQQPPLAKEIAMLVISFAGAMAGLWCKSLQGEPLKNGDKISSQKEDGSQAAELIETDVPQQPCTPTENSTLIIKKTIVVSLIQMLLYSTMFGLCLGVGAVIVPDTAASNFIWVSLTFAGVALMAYATWLNKYIQYNWFLCGLFAFAGLAIVPLGQLPLESPIRYLVCLLLCFGFTTFDLIELWRLARVATMRQVSFTRLFAVGRFMNAIGLFFGFALAYANITTIDTSVQLIWSTLVPGAILLTLGITIAVSIKDSLIDIVIVPESDHEEPKNIQTKRAWRTACDELCKEHELSPREAEVFKLMTRGRDAGYICDALFISNHTVKSHIYHIYQKLDIHSQQELITMVEEKSRSLTTA